MSSEGRTPFEFPDVESQSMRMREDLLPTKEDGSHQRVPLMGHLEVPPGMAS